MLEGRALEKWLDYGGNIADLLSEVGFVCERRPTGNVMGFGASPFLAPLIPVAPHHEVSSLSSTVLLSRVILSWPLLTMD